MLGLWPGRGRFEKCPSCGDSTSFAHAKKEEERRKKEEGRRKKEEGRRKKEERRKNNEERRRKRKK